MASEGSDSPPSKPRYKRFYHGKVPKVSLRWGEKGRRSAIGSYRPDEDDFEEREVANSLVFLSTMPPKETASPPPVQALEQPVSKKNKPSKEISGKAHVCGDCGQSFSSGQALGGHQGKHRVIGGEHNGGNSKSKAVKSVEDANIYSKGKGKVEVEREPEGEFEMRTKVEEELMNIKKLIV